MLTALAPVAADWEEISDQATVVGVFIALCVGIATTLVMIRQEKATREGQMIQQKIAESSAARSESAAALSEEYTRRVVEALELMAAAGAATGAAPARPAVVTWSLRHGTGDSYLLHNEGDATAKNVQLTSHESLILRAPDPEDLAPNEALRFIAARSMATRDSTITVLWNDAESNETKTWKYPLPPKK